MKPIKLETLLVHNDVRIRSRDLTRRAFSADQGYDMDWFPPHLFRVAILEDVAKPAGPDNPRSERWFGITNCEHWQVKDGEDVTMALQSHDKAQVTGMIEIHKKLCQIVESMEANHPPKSLPKSK